MCSTVGGTGVSVPHRPPPGGFCRRPANCKANARDISRRGRLGGAIAPSAGCGIACGQPRVAWLFQIRQFLHRKLGGLLSEFYEPGLKVFARASAYPFQTLSYSIDIYRRRLQPTKISLNLQHRQLLSRSWLAPLNGRPCCLKSQRDASLIMSKESAE